ncbi:hypothetical protein Dimus_026365 [Dionaea muscipula]
MMESVDGKYSTRSTASAAAGVVSLILISSYIIRSWRTNTKPTKSRTPPPPPQAKGAWPIIGHLHILGSSKDLLHVTLAKMAEVYGPIFTIRLGVDRTVVISSPELAKECFTKNDLAVSSRPKFIASELLCYNYAMFGISPYGPYWREMRKISAMELLSGHRLELLKHVRTSEVELAINELYKLWAGEEGNLTLRDGRPWAPVDLKQWFYDLTLNIIVRMVARKRFFGSGAATDREARRCQKSWAELFRMLGVLVVADYIPFLRWLDLGGHQKHMKEVGEQLDSILQGWLDEHRQQQTKSDSSSSSTDQDFVDVLLSVLGNNNNINLGGYEPDVANKSTVMDMIGGSDTIAVVLTWALALLLNDGAALEKAQDELDMQIGKERRVDESDIPNLVYLQAIVKEALRLYPPAPLAAQHLVTEDCTIGGYHVGQGTRLIVNLHQIQRDPTPWGPDPSEFRPERFLTTHSGVDVWGIQHFELIPFGAGRRKCPGIALGLQVVQLALASLLHGFDISPAASHTPVDMSGTNGLINTKAKPLQVLIAPRLSSNLYE